MKSKGRAYSGLDRTDNENVFYSIIKMSDDKNGNV